MCVCVCVGLYWSVKGHGVKAGVDVLVVPVIIVAARGLCFLYMEQWFIQSGVASGSGLMNR